MNKIFNLGLNLERKKHFVTLDLIMLSNIRKKLQNFCQEQLLSTSNNLMYTLGTIKAPCQAIKLELSFPEAG